MNVLHIAHSDYGGAGKAALRLHEGLLAQGVESNFLVLRRASDVPNVLPYRNGAISIPRRLLNRYKAQKIASQWEPYQAARLARPSTFSDDRCTIDLRHHDLVRAADILHLHWISYFVDQKSFFTSVRGRPIVWTLHDMNPFTGGCHFAGPCNKFETLCSSCPQLGSHANDDLAATIWRRKRESYEAHDIHLVAPSRWLHELARKSTLLQNTPISMIPYGLPEVIFAARDKAASRTLLGLPLGKMLVLIGGVNLKDERKGWGYLDAALTKLSTSMNPANIGLAVFGRAPDLTQLENRGLKSYPLGTIKDERLLSAAYSAADLFVISSMEDNLPNTVLEAMACSVPVVGFDSGGIPEMVRDGETGLVVARGDSDGLAQSIQWLLERPEARREMGCRGHEVVLREYTNEIQARRYLELYRDIGSEPARRAAATGTIAETDTGRL